MHTVTSTADKDEVIEHHSLSKENVSSDQTPNSTSEETTKCYGEDGAEVEKQKPTTNKDKSVQILTYFASHLDISS